MKVVEAKLVSASKEQRFKKVPRKAQVVVHGGEGAKRYSSTRHVTMQNDVWIGRNPDPRAEELHKRADEAIARAYNSLDDAKTELTLVKGTEVTAQIAVTEQKIQTYRFAIDELRKEKEKLNQELPPTVQFNF